MSISNETIFSSEKNPESGCLRFNKSLKVFIKTILCKVEIPHIEHEILNNTKLLNNKGLSLQYVLISIIQSAIAIIDEYLSTQINEIIHAPAFQRLEASWRGLSYLVENTSEIRNFKIRILNVRWDILAKDLNLALEFDQSQLFKSIYSNEFDQPGGEPFGLLIADYFISHRGYQSGSLEIETLKKISKVAAAAFTPFITAVNPIMFDLESFADVHTSLSFTRTFQQTEYLKWKTLRDDEDIRFVGLVFPRVLMRLPYSIQHHQTYQFCFNETIEKHENYLWTNSVYYFASVVARAFGQTGWFVEITGVKHGMVTQGLVDDLVKQSFEVDRKGINHKPVLENCLTEMQEKELSDLGFIPLCHCKFTSFAAFYSCQSVQRPKNYDREPVSANARLSTMLHHILCVSRFAHYIKVIVRDKIGAFKSASDCENFLQEWLLGYTAAIDDMSLVNTVKYPLREFKLKLNEQQGRPGIYFCVIQLKPYYQLNELETSLALITELKI